MSIKIIKGNKVKDEDTCENWHKKIYTTDPKSEPVKFTKPPKKYEVGFLARMDNRTAACHVIQNSFNEVCDDIGGLENLSHIEICLVERYCFLEFFVKSLEARIANYPKKSGKLIGRWVQALNSMVGLCKCLGLQRKVKRVTNLNEYMTKKAMNE